MQESKNEMRHWGTTKELEILQTEICAIWIRPILFSEEIIAQMLSYVDVCPWCMSFICPVYVIFYCVRFIITGAEL